MRVRRLGLLLLALAAASIAPASAAAITLEPVGSFSSPVFVSSDPADEDRLFVVEQGGKIQLHEDGATSTFLDLTATGLDLVATGGERGLLSMTFAPDFGTTGHFYVYYTRNGVAGAELGDIQIDAFTASGDTAGSRRAVLTIEHSSAGNHNGGQLQTGPDGLLYIATGDGGGGGDPDNNAQNTASLLGKVLRIDPDQVSPGYSIPATNPYVGVAGADEVWTVGLRNPWRFSFDRLTGDLLIGDVGQGAWEELDYAAAPDAGKGLNFGWDCREGPAAGNTPSPACPTGGFTEPIHAYKNFAIPGGGGVGCAVTGGFVVRDPSLPTLIGRYVYGDYCAGQLRSLDPDAANPAATDAPVPDVGSVGSLSSFGEDSCGRVYAVSQGGPVYRITGDSPPDCSPPPVQHALEVSVGGGGTGNVETVAPSLGISCPTDCEQSYAEGEEVTLAATPTGGSSFDGWGGDCSGTGDCELVLDADRTVTATFGPAPPAPTCAGVPATIVGVAGEPVMGTSGVDVIVGTSKLDRIDAREGDDIVCADGGRDRIRAGAGEDIVRANRGADRLRGAAGADLLQGGVGRDRCFGGPGDDRERSC